MVHMKCNINYTVNGVSNFKKLCVPVKYEDTPSGERALFEYMLNKLATYHGVASSKVRILRWCETN